MSLGTIILILMIAGTISGCIWISYYVLRRARKAYFDLYHKVANVELRVEQRIEQTHHVIEQKIEQVHQHVKQVEHHLLLQHLSDMAGRAKEKDLIDSETYNKSIQLFHELKMDNLKEKKTP